MIHFFYEIFINILAIQKKLKIEKIWKSTKLQAGEVAGVKKRVRPYWHDSNTSGDLKKK